MTCQVDTISIHLFIIWFLYLLLFSANRYLIASKTQDGSYSFYDEYNITNSIRLCQEFYAILCPSVSVLTLIWLRALDKLEPNACTNERTLWLLELLSEPKIGTKNSDLWCLCNAAGHPHHLKPLNLLLCLTWVGENFNFNHLRFEVFLKSPPGRIYISCHAYFILCKHTI